MKKYILAIDQGTTSSRAILFNHAGQIHGMTQQEYPQIFPAPGWVEHDANAIWHSQLAVAQQVLKEQHLSAADIAAIGITNQRETTVLWDRQTGEPIAHAIVWQDRRTAALCDQLRADGKAPLFQQKTGLVLDSYFSGTKLKWLLDHTPGARVRAERGELAFGTIDSWLIFKLSGNHVTDTSNASRTLLFNIHTKQWDDELLALLDIPHSLLPAIVPSSGIVGQTYTSLFGQSIPIAGIAGDQQAATFGQACHRPGMAKNTYGTGCFMLLNTGTQAIASHNNLLTTIGWTLGNDVDARTDYMLEGSVFMAGAIIQWLRDGLGIIQHSSDVEALATSVPDNGGVVFIPAFSGLGAPYWDPYARGTIVGMTRGSNKAHIARAALESIAYQTVDVLEAMQKDAQILLQELRVDGGAARNDLLMQFQADMLNVPVIRPVVTETTALGAAYLAGLAVAFWESKEEIATQWQMERRFEPRMTDDEHAQRLYTWHRAVQRAQAWNI
ncbi:Glycerol kinase (ATP:glycerol 3-phosphotransferase) (Glycerokinase) (GK) [Herminiimonas arsenicoxydans]|uniref:Glycerol kinase n=1 Tax=Herminiimonas arsenicoxydans TaxID=204773 RepID=GLPK_HERAR|nr:RecName: Full=Glycerol kinase; AltName: Full=ATP:glycerol 3-phosphotransferase; AltName: Full=Glycerokinase; Short=GK [Herminiimonas arsenicoxydans]CAL60444.1 Glycerol kinase (ATP:glycerol 3-phosphotransferase) (Glycerokinase) (GK) [Herminiimonas arsenicoxydans]